MTTALPWLLCLVLAGCNLLLLAFLWETFKRAGLHYERWQAENERLDRRLDTLLEYRNPGLILTGRAPDEPTVERVPRYPDEY